LETLSALIEDYEDSRTPIQTGGLDLVQTLKYLMAGRGMSASDLGRLLGNRSLGSAILRGTRQISKANALLLAKHFRVSSALFLVS
jgi:antitoxin component HigA of HigAB toxin-antitoxin module